MRQLTIPGLLVGAALALAGCKYAGRSQTFIPLLMQPDAHKVREGLAGIAPPNSQVIREILQSRKGSGGPWLRFVVIGDTISDHNIAYREMLAIISGLDPRPEFIINLGDFTTDRLGAQSYYLDTIKNYPLPIVHIMGNHETAPGARRITRAIFGELDFFFDYGDIRFICMGSGSHGMTDRRLHWLEDALRDERPAKKIFLAHEFPVGPFQEVFSGLYSAFIRKPQNEDRLLDLFERYGVALAFFGHLHRHQQKVHHGTVMVISGGGGQRNLLEPKARQPLSTKQRHFTLIDMVTAPEEPVQGVITCISRANEPLFMNSFYRSLSYSEAGGSDGQSAVRRMHLVPYDPSDRNLAHPPYLGPLHESYSARIARDGR